MENSCKKNNAFGLTVCVVFSLFIRMLFDSNKWILIFTGKV
jgi:hypothetical protein